MIVTKITNHISQAFARLMEQYKKIPQNYELPLVSQPGSTISVSAFTGILGTMVDQIQLIENALFDLDAGRQLFNGTTFPAIGAQLDGIGSLVGIVRNGLSDAEYLLFILATIAENNSDTTENVVLNVTSLIFQTNDPILAFDFYPAEFSLQIPTSSALQSSLYPFAINAIKNTLGAGIGLGFVSMYPFPNAFQVTTVGGPQVGGGCGDLNHPGEGGQLAGNIFSNIEG